LREIDHKLGLTKQIADLISDERDQDPQPEVRTDNSEDEDNVLQQNQQSNLNQPDPRRNMFATSFGYDPLLCPECHNTLQPSCFFFQKKFDLLAMHKKIACK